MDGTALAGTMIAFAALAFILALTAWSARSIDRIARRPERSGREIIKTDRLGGPDASSDGSG